MASPLCTEEISQDQADKDGIQGTSREETPSKGVGIFTEAGNHSSDIVSPAIAEDSDIVEGFLTTTAATRGRRLACAVPLGNASSTRTARHLTLLASLQKLRINREAHRAQRKGSGRSRSFLSPVMSTVMAIMLNVGGRPNTTMLGNGGLLGLAIAFSNAFGLHRHPFNWNMPSSEKQLRIRIWCIWNSDACSSQHDIPLPNSQDVCSSNVSPSQVTATSVFVSLITLTEVLGSYLEYICHIAKTPTDHFEKTIAQPEVLLAPWEETLGDDIRRTLKNVCYNIFNLIEIGGRRKRVKAQNARYTSGPKEQLRITSILCKNWMSHICTDFCIPANAFTLTSAASFLMRSVLRSRNSRGNNTPLKLARDMIDALERHRRDFSWDLADNWPALPNFEEYSDTDVSVLGDLLTGFSDPFEMELNPAANAVEHI
ncbi:uncharacterized protein PADG_05730 [Paracoccidioides brasiliensis Pb18]|uniref:Transcription factor domain-containing protein n=1 Tax=Paracoccidioides brasiliensis (strain Pb18) TaxID=502780 RepID=C1GEP4_PARBD|nr:uncharacterized protein PADG_05730 [Paracoccidioides brasiliensis Pb18]EEH49651.2 hypothetical protein PADG_05730 [Paracoccidioides brasiliensis Pb18]